ncbi:helix-turn-helix domain-containing protein [Streptomyces flavochromogenes]|uniref:Helix-turn-helix domain-containing protein n=1 Tax=Streptomyces flavochromogenes TaxID=68199 RepID=A0ABW6Y3H3_9ACTN
MNKGEHTVLGVHVEDEQNARTAPGIELGRRIDEGRARAGLSQEQLRIQAGLGRTTVSQAISPRGPVPSVDTVTALARTLGLPLGKLLQLQWRAKEEEQRVGITASAVGAPGRPLGQWEPHELEVHPAGPDKDVSDPGTPRARVLPGYVQRRHDRVLAEAVGDSAAGRSRIVVLVGTSSTGKTRACWEAVQPLANAGWRLWHPFDPTRAEAALAELGQVEPRTVVWLNEAQHYFGDHTSGERIAAALHRLLMDEEQRPVLVLVTLWPEYARQYTSLAAPSGDPHSQVRELLAGHMETVPDAFDAAALTAAATLAEQGDRLLADALTRARDSGLITQDLAGAPELLRRYEQATGPARALLEVAMDARRLGVGLHLPQAFLTDAAPDYLSEHDYDQLTEDWAELAYAELAEPVHGKQAPLRRTALRPPRRPPAPATSAEAAAQRPAGPVVRLADYLEEHGRTVRRRLCPPASFWHAAHTHLTRFEDLRTLARGADSRHRLQWVYHLRHRAAALGDTSVLSFLAMAHEEAGDREGAEGLARHHAVHGDTHTLVRLAELRQQAGDREGAVLVLQQAAAHGSTSAVLQLAELQEGAEHQERAERILRQRIDDGDTRAIAQLVQLRHDAGDGEGAEARARHAAYQGDTHLLSLLAQLRENAGDRKGAEALALQAAADHEDTDPLFRLAEHRYKEGDRTGATVLFQKAAAHGNTYAMALLAGALETAGYHERAERLLQQVADRGNTDIIARQAELQEQNGDRKGAERFLQYAADHGHTPALVRLAALRREARDREGAEQLLQQAVDHGDQSAITPLARLREEAGDREGAEHLFQQAADHGDTRALADLVELRERAGNSDGAEALARHIAGQGDTIALTRLAMMREKAGNKEDAEALAWKALDHGDRSCLVRLVIAREAAGDRIEALARQFADQGYPRDKSLTSQRLRDTLLKLWPYGLDPDGVPTPPWQPIASEVLG